MTETPLVVESVEIQPVRDIAMRVEVTVKIFKSGDILVESGNRRQYIPFRLTRGEVASNGFISTALAATELVGGVEYNVKVLHYLESVTPLDGNKVQRVRLYDDGTRETSVIDIRSNKVLETKTDKKSLTDAERTAVLIAGGGYFAANALSELTGWSWVKAWMTRARSRDDPDKSRP